MLSGIDFQTGGKRATELAFATPAAATPTDKVKYPFSGCNRSHFGVCGGVVEPVAGKLKVSEQNRSHFRAKSQLGFCPHCQQRKALLFQWLSPAFRQLPGNADLDHFWRYGGLPFATLSTGLTA